MIKLEVYFNGQKIPSIEDLAAREIGRNKEIIEAIQAAKTRASNMPRKAKKAFKALIASEEKLLLG